MSLDKRLGVNGPGSPSGVDNDDGDNLDGNSGGRTVDNVYAEMRRRHEKFQDQINERFSTMEGLLQSFVSGQGTANNPAANANNTRSGGGLTIAELRAARDDEDDPVRREQINDLIIERLTEERTQKALDMYSKRLTDEEVERQANETALARYTDLRRPGSDLYQEVQRALQLRADADRPGVILDVANEVAARLGISPSQNMRDYKYPTAPGNSRNKPSGPSQHDEDEELDVVSDEELEALRAKFGGAFKNGKMTDEHLKSIKGKDRELKKILRDYGPQALQS